MDKVDRFLLAKKNKAQLNGKREAYAATILNLVVEELGLPIKKSLILKFS
jgi:hypothetical protein